MEFSDVAAAVPGVLDGAMSRPAGELVASRLRRAARRIAWR
jgi:hypothetical protein